MKSISWLSILVLLMLAACETPPPAYQGIRITMGETVTITCNGGVPCAAEVTGTLPITDQDPVGTRLKPFLQSLREVESETSTRGLSEVIDPCQNGNCLTAVKAKKDGVIIPPDLRGKVFAFGPAGGNPGSLLAISVHDLPFERATRIYGRNIISQSEQALVLTDPTGYTITLIKTPDGKSVVKLGGFNSFDVLKTAAEVEVLRN